MRHCIFNLGFIAVRSDTQGREFAAWWAARLRDACFDAASGSFTDQKYSDPVPALFDRVAIVRDPGWNVASWNLSRRLVRVTDSGDITVNGVPLAFYHFTRHGGLGDAMTERNARGSPEPHELWRWYARRLAAHADPVLETAEWHYARFNDGMPISLAIRHYYRQRPHLTAYFDDPYDVTGDSLRGWLERNAPEVFTS